MNKETIKLSADAEAKANAVRNLSMAVSAVDPEVDGDWVKAGPDKDKPKLQAVQDVIDRGCDAKLTRQEVEAALPGWNRLKAIEVAIGRGNYAESKKWTAMMKARLGYIEATS